jgi:small subunit ribosomal protein S20
VIFFIDISCSFYYINSAFEPKHQQNKESMATHKSALKRIRQTGRRTLHNRQYRSAMKTMIKNVLAAKDQQAAEKDLLAAVSLLDKLAQRRIIHRNKAANQKSRLTRFFNKLPAAPVSA